MADFADESSLPGCGRREKKCHGKHLPEEAKKHAVIITCMDARIDPLRDFGDLKVGDAYVIRNGGGRCSDDAIRSAVLAIRLFAVNKVFVVQHTDCGLEKVSDPEVRELLHESLGPARLGEPAPPSGKDNRDIHRQADYTAFLAFNTSLEKNVRNDVARFQGSPLVSKHVKVSGFIYDVDKEELRPV